MDSIRLFQWQNRLGSWIRWAELCEVPCWTTLDAHANIQQWFLWTRCYRPFICLKKKIDSEEKQVIVRHQKLSWKRHDFMCNWNCNLYPKTPLAFWVRTDIGQPQGWLERPGLAGWCWFSDANPWHTLFLRPGSTTRVGFSWGALSLQNPLFTGSTASVHKRKRHRETLDTHGHKCPKAQQSPLLQAGPSLWHDKTLRFSLRPKPFTHHQVMSAHKASWSHFFLTQI